MASVEDAITALQQALDALDDVRQHRGAAYDEAEQVRDQVAAAGLQGMADQLGHVVDTIEQISPTVESCADAIREALDAAKAAIA